jgi:hypothetical protein
MGVDGPDELFFNSGTQYNGVGSIIDHYAALMSSALRRAGWL